MTTAPMNLVPFQQALERDDVDAVQAYLNAQDQVTANELLRLVGERYGFITAEACGVRCQLGADLSQRLYRTSDVSSLKQLLAHYGEPLLSLRSVGYDTQQTSSRPSASRRRPPGPRSPPTATS